MGNTWNPADRDRAINAGKSGAKLDWYDQQQLQKEAKQAGSIGRAAREALEKQGK